MPDPRKNLTVPDIGEIFRAVKAPRRGYEEDGPAWETFIVSSWLRRQAEPAADAPPAGPDRVPLEWCRRSEAEYVAGHGASMIIARVADIELRGRASGGTRVRRDREHATRMVGRPLGRAGRTYI
jgi:hypothetical protein